MILTIKAWRDLDHPQAGGSEQLVDQLARGSRARGHEVTVLAGDPVGARPYRVIGTGGTFDQYLRGPFVERRHAPRADLVLDVANGMVFCSPLVRRGPTVLLVHHVHTEQWATMFPAPVAFGGRTFETKIVPRVYRRCLVIAVSESTAAALEATGFRADQIRIVHNAVSLEPPSITKSTEPLFLVLGRLTAPKRIEIVLRAWPAVRQQTGGRLIIAGDGPERDRLETMATEGVSFVGFVDDDTKSSLMGEAWLLLHPSMHEGWGIVITEAARHETPAVGFDVPGVRDAIRHGSTGVLADDEEAFAGSWIRLANDAIERSAMGRAAAELASTFTEDRTIDGFLAVAHEAIDRGKGEAT